MPVWTAARAAELEGVHLPDTLQAGGDLLHLNGFGLRTWSFLAVRIYVVGLYLDHPSSNPGEIIQSADTKLLKVHFLRDVSAESARKAWREGFANNCLPPCHLDQADVEQFLAEVPAMNPGDDFSLLFVRHTATVTVNGRVIGSVPKPALADAMLASFLGPKPASAKLKQALLGDPG
jgi:hypothetical protein